MPPSNLSSSAFPTVRFGQGPGPRSNDCDICKSALEPQETSATHTACQNTFHKECLTSWHNARDALRRVTNCPMCRRPLNAADFHRLRLTESEVIQQFLQTTHTQARRNAQVAWHSDHHRFSEPDEDLDEDELPEDSGPGNAATGGRFPQQQEEPLTWANFRQPNWATPARQPFGVISAYPIDLTSESTGSQLAGRSAEHPIDLTVESTGSAQQHGELNAVQPTVPSANIIDLTAESSDGTQQDGQSTTTHPTATLRATGFPEQTTALSAHRAHQGFTALSPREPNTGPTSHPSQQALALGGGLPAVQTEGWSFNTGGLGSRPNVDALARDTNRLLPNYRSPGSSHGRDNPYATPPTAYVARVERGQGSGQAQASTQQRPTRTFAQPSAFPPPVIHRHGVNETQNDDAQDAQNTQSPQNVAEHQSPEDETSNDDTQNA